MKTNLYKPILVSLFGMMITSISPAQSKSKVEDSIIVQRATITNAQKSQKKIDSLASQSDTLLEDYRLTLQQTENLKKYNDQLVKLVESQEKEKRSIEDQIKGIEKTSTEIVPLMLKMIATLEEFVRLDMPFLRSERQHRISSLKEMMDRADVSVSEKYRRILEAYQIENQYGRDVASYRDSIEIDGTMRTVEVLKVGRIALIYLTLDGTLMKAWDQKKRHWVVIPENFRNSIKKGLKIAKKQVSPDIMTLPIPGPEALP